ncbi:hypothetical protein ACTFIU_000561 [Dictyostelium citrinum]
MKLALILYKLTIFLLLLSICNSIDVIEEQCLLKIVNNVKDKNLNIPNITSLFCGMSSFNCYTNGSVQQLNLRSSNSYSISNTDISCFPNLYIFMASNLTIDQSLLKTKTASLSAMTIDSNNILDIDFEIAPLTSFSWSDYSRKSLTITPFALKNVQSFTSYSIVNLVNSSNNINYINNYTETYTAYTDYIPDLTKMIKINRLQVDLDPKTFQESSYINIAKYSSIVKYIAINSYGYIRFPHEIAYSNTPRNSITFRTKGFFAPTSPIDLSNIEGINTFSISNMGNDFHYQNKFPFSKLPLKGITFSFSNGNISTIDWNIFNNIKNLKLIGLNLSGPIPTTPFFQSLISFDLSGNQFTGTLDDSLCLVELNVRNNSLTGKIPNCFYCYLNNSFLGGNFANNYFNNYDTVNNKCGYDLIKPYILYQSPSFYLKGKNIGFYDYNIKMGSNCAVLGGNGDFRIYGCLTTANYTTLTILNQNLNFTLSLDRTAPIIDSVIQSNNTLTISGSYFSYEPSIMKVTIGDTPLNCKINNNNTIPTFYSIQCDIEYPVIEYGPKNVIVQVNSLISKPFEINLDYTKFECPISDCNDNGICNDHIGVCECSKDWKTIDQDICTVAIHYLSSYSQTSDIDGGIINLYGFFGNVHNDFMVLIDGNEYSPNVPPTSSVIAISIGSGKIGTNSSIEIIQNGLTFHGTIYPYSNLIKECPSNCNNNNGKCNTTTGECTCNNGYTGVDCIKTTNSTLPTIAPTISNVGALFRSEQTAFTASIYKFIEVDYKGTIIKYVTISPWKTETIDQGIKYIGTSSNGTSTFEITFLKVSKNQQFSFAGNEYNVGAGGIKMSITVSNYTYSNQSNYLVAALQAKAESYSGETNQNKCNNGTIVITSQSNSNLTLNNYNYFTISKDGKRLSIRLQDRLISDDQSTYMVNQLKTILPDQSLLFGMSLPHCGKQCSIDGPDFIVNIESNYKTASSCPTSSNSDSEPSSSLKDSSISFILLIVSILISLLF